MCTAKKETKEAGLASVRIHGFTLIELLAVLAIIGLLTALLIPAIISVRKSAHQAKNVSNLRTIHQGVLLVAIDGPPGYGKGSGFFPSYAGSAEGGLRYVWTHLVAEKLGYMERDGNQFRFLIPLNETVFRNPLREDDLVTIEDASAYNNLNHHSHYAYNVHLGSFSSPFSRDEGPPYGHVMQHQVTNPSNTILITESDGDNLLDAMGHAAWAPPGRNEDPDNATCVFVDGRVATLPRSEILGNPEKYLFPFRND